MKNKRIFYGFIFMMSVLVICLVTTTSCKDDEDENPPVEKVKGCTDPNSLTYNPAAEEDDGTCVQAEVKERALFLNFTATW